MTQSIVLILFFATLAAVFNWVARERGFFKLNGIPITHVSLSPLTGRKHQLRVHMAHIGHPILGDYMYDPGFQTTDTEYRTMLHALKIRIPFPGLDKPIEVCTEDPFVPMISSANQTQHHQHPE